MLNAQSKLVNLTHISPKILALVKKSLLSQFATSIALMVQSLNHHAIVFLMNQSKSFCQFLIMTVHAKKRDVDLIMIWIKNHVNVKEKNLLVAEKNVNQIS
jgi:hypothetical protein